MQPGRRRWLLPITAGAAYAALAAATAGSPVRRERELFSWLNASGEELWPLRIPQQAGTPWVLPALGIAAWLSGRRRLAVAAGLSLPVEKALEVGTKRLSRRPRPSIAVPGAKLRDDAPSVGAAFPSGHAAIAACAVTLASTELPPAVTAGLATLAGLTAYTRVRQGAHHPTDAVGGLLLGTTVGSALLAALRVNRELR